MASGRGTEHWTQSPEWGKLGLGGHRVRGEGPGEQLGTRAPHSPLWWKAGKGKNRKLAKAAKDHTGENRCVKNLQVVVVVVSSVRLSALLQPREFSSTRLLCPWDFSGKSTGGLPCLPPGDIPHTQIELVSRISPALAGRFFAISTTWEAFIYTTNVPNLLQFSSVAQSCPTLCDPMNCSTPGLPVHHQLPEITQTHVHRVRDAIYPLLSPSPPAPNPSQHQGLFQ